MRRDRPTKPRRQIARALGGRLEPRLTDAARTEQRDDPFGRHQSGKLGDFAFAPDHRSRGRWQVVLLVLGWRNRHPARGHRSTPWRREGDSNPRGACTPNGFQDRRIRPLCHPSRATSLRRSPATETQDSSCATITTDYYERIAIKRAEMPSRLDRPPAKLHTVV